MPARTVAMRSTDAPPTIAEAFAELRARQEIPTDFPPAAIAVATTAAAQPRLPTFDRTDLELITIDPPGSRDLDQALHLRRVGDGYLVSYAIADVAAFVTAGDPVDQEAQRRGQTLYAPDLRTPLHPLVLSEGAASLLPNVDRPALLWTLELDGRGELVETGVVRARVRSREQLSYQQAQREIDGGAPRETLALLVEVGRLRAECERDRGGVSLQIPAQEIGVDAHGTYALSYRATLPVEEYNAQISLLTGMAAARLMLDAQIGIVRTLPPAEPDALRRLRRTARALHIAWPEGRSYPEFVRSLDPAVPANAAMLNACTELFRGAGYTSFDGSLPERTRHAALAGDYAHVTAPLRRLVDRCAGEVCLAVCAKAAGTGLGTHGIARLARGDVGCGVAREAVRAGDGGSGGGLAAPGPGRRDIHRYGDRHRVQSDQGRGDDRRPGGSGSSSRCRTAARRRGRPSTRLGRLEHRPGVLRAGVSWPSEAARSAPGRLSQQSSRPGALS